MLSIAVVNLELDVDTGAGRVLGFYAEAIVSAIGGVPPIANDSLLPRMRATVVFSPKSNAEVLPLGKIQIDLDIAVSA